MSLIVSLYSAILFFVLVPGILLTLPKKGSKFVVAGVHALVFALVFHFTHKLVWRLGASLEGLEGMNDTVVEKPESMKKETKKETSESSMKNISIPEVISK